MSNTAENLNIITELNGEITELTDEETEFLFEFRMCDSEQQSRIQKLMEDVKSEFETKE